jgi:hypothetical protein
MKPELIYCADGNPRFAQIAIQAGFLYGAQLPKKIYFPIHFADQDFKRPRYVGYIKALRHHKPYMASVLDIEEWRRLDEILMRAEEVSQFCQVVMLIPKVPGIIKYLPAKIREKPVRLGYSVPTSYGKTIVPIREFDGWPVHLLGGSPSRQHELSREMDVKSVDGNYHQLMSRYNQFFCPSRLTTARNSLWPTLLEADGQRWGNGGSDADAPYEAFRRSCKAIMAMWSE